MIVRELVAKLGFDIDIATLKRFGRSINDAKKGMYEIGQRAQVVGRGFRNVGLGLSLGATIPVALLGRTFIRSASDAEEAEQRFNVVFRDLGQGANEVARAFGKEFGIARSASKELLGTTGDLLTGFGFTQERALSLADRVARLGGDLASFNNIQGGTEEAVNRLTKGVLGETENLKLLGIVVNQGTKEFKDRVKQLMAQTGATLQQAKAKAETILATAYEQSKNALGDFARTSDGFANRSRIFKARLRDLSVEFGRILLPTANKVLLVFLKIAERLDKLPTPVKKGILVFLGIIAVVGPLLLIIGTLIIALGAVVKGAILLKATWLILGPVIGALALPLLKIIVILALVGVVIWLLIDDFRAWAAEGDSVLGVLFGSFDTFKGRVKKVFDAVKEAFASLWAFFKHSGEKETQRLIDAFLNLGKVILKSLFFLIGGFFRAIGLATIGVIKIVLGIGKRILDGFKATRFGKILSNFFGGDEETPAGSRAFTPFLPGQVPLIPPSADSLGGAGPVSRDVNVRQDIRVEVPPGTPEQQRNYLQETADEIFKENMNKMLSETILASPKAEK